MTRPKQKFMKYHFSEEGFKEHNEEIVKQELDKLYRRPFYVALDEWGQPSLFLTKKEALADTKGNLKFVKKLSKDYWVYVEDSNGEDRYIGRVYLNKLKKEIPK